MPDNNADKYQLLTDVTEAVENPSALQEVADMKQRLKDALGVITAASIAYTPSVLSDWSGSVDPGDMDDALNQLAARTTINESDIDALEIAINALISQGSSQVLSQIVSGGELIWLQDLDFLVTAAVYYINGTLYRSDAQEITADAADNTDPRIDVAALDNLGVASFITGTAAADPSEPDIDPATQVQVGFVFIDANATEPTVEQEVIYKENTGEAAEWTSSTSGSGFNANSANNPRTGTKDIEGTAVANNAYVRMSNNASINPNDYTYLIFYIRSKAAWNNNRFLRIQFQLAGVKKGATLTLGNGFFNFNSSNTTDYQGIVIPIASFAIPAGTLVDQLQIQDSGGSIGFYIDDITLQKSSQIVINNPNATIPGGLDKNIQYNDAGVFGGEAGFEYDKATNTMSVVNATVDILSLTTGANVGINSQALSGTLTLTTASKRYQSLDPDGSARNVDLPAEAAGLAFFIVNRGDGAEVITVRNDAAGTVDTIDNDEGLSVICDGTRWISAKATLVIV